MDGDKYRIVMGIYDRGVAFALKNGLNSHFRKRQIASQVELGETTTSRAVMTLTLPPGTELCKNGFDKLVGESKWFPSDLKKRPRNIQITKLEGAQEPVPVESTPDYSNHPEAIAQMQAGYEKKLVASERRELDAFEKICELEVKLESKPAALEKEVIVKKPAIITSPLQGFYSFMRTLKDGCDFAAADYDVLRFAEGIGFSGTEKRSELVGRILGVDFKDDTVQVHLERLRQQGQSINKTYLDKVQKELKEREAQIDLYGKQKTSGVGDELLDVLKTYSETASKRIGELNTELENKKRVVAEAKAILPRVEGVLENYDQMVETASNVSKRSDITIQFPVLINGFENQNLFITLLKAGYQNFNDRVAGFLGEKGFAPMEPIAEDFLSFTGYLDKRKTPPKVVQYFNELFSQEYSPTARVGLTPRTMAFHW
ncbi:hypothetical protein HN832_04265 [archaeon]|jgi:hypothetical protein|nr:hypothetical protein [archaeon]MBT4373391.1 hypothetical protein [archaeon]MBT4531839.1 hypothetical protein [archaeon]MBT7001506.1 hypothetical protein [archaeon]MBT7282602.1 hypothetical protein [archaeon]